MLRHTYIYTFPHFPVIQYQLIKNIFKNAVFEEYIIITKQKPMKIY